MAQEQKSEMPASSKAEMSFLDHLEELRWHLVRSAVAVVFLTVIVFVNKTFLFDKILFGPRNLSFVTYRFLCRLSEVFRLDDAMCVKEIPFTLINVDMAGQFMTHIYISLVAGFVIAFPYVFWELWRFVQPALHTTEKRYTKQIVISGSLLFLTGILFGYFVLAPMSILFLGSYQISSEVANQITLDSYISLLAMMVLLCGIVFELPLLSYILAKLGILTPQFMRKYRKHSIVVIFIAAGILTPSPDVTSQVLVALPLLLLYEASIIVVARVRKQDA